MRTRVLYVRQCVRQEFMFGCLHAAPHTVRPPPSPQWVQECTRCMRLSKRCGQWVTARRPHARGRRPAAPDTARPGVVIVRPKERARAAYAPPPPPRGVPLYVPAVPGVSPWSACSASSAFCTPGLAHRTHQPTKFERNACGCVRCMRAVIGYSTAVRDEQRC